MASRLRAEWSLADPALVDFLRNRAATLASPSKQGNAQAVRQQTERPQAGEARAALVGLRNKLQVRTQTRFLGERRVCCPPAALCGLRLCPHPGGSLRASLPCAAAWTAQTRVGTTPTFLGSRHTLSPSLRVSGGRCCSPAVTDARCAAKTARFWGFDAQPVAARGVWLQVN